MAILGGLQALGFDLHFSYHADAILVHDFPEAAEQLEAVLGSVRIPIEEVVRGGGGEAAVTQRLRRSLTEMGWNKVIFRIEKKINGVVTRSESHEIDHVKSFPDGTIALEIEWNNKDPFFDRDLENFNRLHDDGAISIGIIVTRGESFQAGISDMIREFGYSRGIAAFSDLETFGLEPTRRQRQEIEKAMATRSIAFAEAWAAQFVSDKFGSATTHWAKLAARLERGVGNPCPLVGIGIPIGCLL